MTKHPFAARAILTAVVALTVVACKDSSAPKGVSHANDPPLTAASTVVAGDLHTCALSTAGVAYCWGENAFGALGDNGSAGLSTPGLVSGSHVFVSLTAGSSHTCGLTSDGTAYCWGWNFFGQLGDSSNATRRAPSPVAGGIKFASLAAGAEHTCGLAGSGTLYCWGNNSSGQLGDGSSTSRSIPVPVTGGITFASVAAGDSHTCGLTAAGQASCWGFDLAGQLGDGGSGFTPRTAPVAVTGGVTFTSLTLGGDGGVGFTCGLAASGLYCWGNNSDGQFGNGGNAGASTPLLTTTTVVFARIVTGSSQTCGLTSAGVAYCWGYNGSSGALGDGTTTNRNVPTAVSGSTLFAAIASGAGHTCGISLAGAVFCWGYNAAGQLGDGTMISRNVPTPISTQ